ncbi:hypothetical protein EYZ11_001024 [Aspergillus tanneri]|uniref:Uncharacterized protein n=1 Tax=Aspergillus tanneri TaxID=1220188 RepID=A0A4S3JVM9_9EURO|nr:hypothetical protein EYZ11_001024 [Aspergillus tanneri]
MSQSSEISLGLKNSIEGPHCMQRMSQSQDSLPDTSRWRLLRSSRPLSSTLSSRQTTPASIPTPRPENDVNEVSPDNVWQANTALSSLNNALTASDLTLLPPDLQNFCRAPLSHSSTLHDCLPVSDSLVRSQPHNNCSSESDPSSDWLAGSLSDGSIRARFPSISPLWPGSVPNSGDSRRGGDSWENSSVSFAALLEKCSELDQAADILKDREQWTAINHHLIPVLRAIDALCDLCAAFIAEHPTPCSKELLDSALVALVIAANFKILEVCGLLVSISVSDVQRPHDQLLLKRIDFNLTQTKIALTSMKEQEMTSRSVFQTALDQAARIHQQIMVMTEG